MNKVIVLGGDHYNALGLVRCFGLNGIRPYGILTTNSKSKKNNFCYSSKFWEKYWFALSEEEAIKILKREFSNEVEKPVLVPSSDGMALIIDTNLDELSKSFICPSIKGTQGKIAELMDKNRQVEWAQKLGIRTAKTWCVNLNKDFSNLLLEFKYPCIVKPVISSEGEKADITRCDDTTSLKWVLSVLKEKDYKRILIQEFLNKDFEAELFGCIGGHSGIIPYLFSKHVREWPPVGGSVSCHEFIKAPLLIAQAEELLRKIKEYGYVGNIDIELFVIGDELVLNEVNFRNSGDVYSCFYHKLYYPYFSYLDMIDGDTSCLNTSYTTDKYAMNETTDFRHVIYGKLSLKEWLKYWKRSRDYAYYFSGDMKPAMKKYWYFMKKFFTKRDDKNTPPRCHKNRD